MNGLGNVGRSYRARIVPIGAEAEFVKERRAHHTRVDERHRNAVPSGLFAQCLRKAAQRKFGSAVYGALLSAAERSFRSQ